jgi:hypothetical protein
LYAESDSICICRTIVCEDKLVTTGQFSVQDQSDLTSTVIVLRVWDLCTRTLEHTALCKEFDQTLGADANVEMMCTWRDKLLVVVGDDNCQTNVLQIWNRQTWNLERSVDVLSLIPSAQVGGWDGIYYGQMFVVEKAQRADDRLVVSMNKRLGLFSFDPLKFDHTLPLPRIATEGEQEDGSLFESRFSPNTATMCEHLLVMADNGSPVLGIWDTRDWTFVHVFQTAASDWLPALTTWGDKVVGHTCRGDMHVWDILDRTYLGYKVPFRDDCNCQQGGCECPEYVTQIAGTWDDKLVVVTPSVPHYERNNESRWKERVWALKMTAAGMRGEDGGDVEESTRIALGRNCLSTAFAL